MDKFTEVYEEAFKTIHTGGEFSKEWEDFFKTRSRVKSLFGKKGLNSLFSETPATVRYEIGLKSTGAFLHFFGKGEGVDDVIYAAAQNEKNGTIEALNKRVATLKFIKHLYRASKSGGQDVWVYSPPASYAGWVFDEIKGAEDNVKKKLREETEIFRDSDKKNMCAALALSRKIAMDAQNKLASPNNETKKIIKRWFLHKDSKSDLAGAISTLSQGFKKIANTCNSTSLVFADFPDWRKKRNKYYGAAYRGGEGGGFPVIYLEGAFTRMTGNSGKLWLCAETIIHEFSHHDLSTHDHRYDSDGLKPDSAKFPYEKTIQNADSWGYFALDLAGYLSVSDRDNYLK